MKANDYLVSICIPTYNRAKYLKNTIESIVSQKPFQDKRVEIAVTDNASEDNTESLCRDYEKHYTNFRYYRNPVNIYDRNFPICLQNAQGDLRKLCNDTVLLMPGSLNTIVDLAEKYRTSRPILFFENGIYNRVKPWKKESFKVGVRSQHDTCTSELSFEEFMLRETYWLTSLANLSFWAEDCQSDSQPDKEIFSLKLWQVSYLAGILACGRRTVGIKERLFSIQETDRTVYAGDSLLYKIFYSNLFSILDPYFTSGQLSRHCRYVVEKDLLLSFFLQKVAEYEVNDSIPREKLRELKASIGESYKNKDYYGYFKCLYMLKVMKSKFEKHIAGKRD